MEPSSPVKLLDYRQEKASDDLVPNPAVLSSTQWQDIHLELHQQPKFETLEHQHTMHVIAFGVGDALVPGERSLDGKLRPERRNRGDIAIIPAGIAHYCNWNTSAQFGILAIEPILLQQVGLVDSDRIELIPRFMNEGDTLIRGIFDTLKDELVSPQIGGSLLIDRLQTALAIHLLRKYCRDCGTNCPTRLYSDRTSPIPTNCTWF